VLPWRLSKRRCRLIPDRDIKRCRRRPRQLEPHLGNLAADKLALDLVYVSHIDEDHIAGVCETMRFAIAVQQRPPEDQKALFDRFLYRGASAFCSAVSASKEARFYRLVANFLQAFLEVEKTAFEMVG
jgi:TorA maturation chaperone TorD